MIPASYRLIPMVLAGACALSACSLINTDSQASSSFTPSSSSLVATSSATRTSSAPRSLTSSSSTTHTPTSPSTTHTPTSSSTTSAPASSSTTSAPSATNAPSTAVSGAPKDTINDTHVRTTRDRFHSLAPDSLFSQFDSCAPNGVGESMACSGAHVGQFQFFASDAKAASTTQILTGLRSSRVIEDTGRFVIGWSTVGNTAIITVVDNDEGLVLQQMVSTDEVDPTNRIYELGLAQKKADPQ